MSQSAGSTIVANSSSPVLPGRALEQDPERLGHLLAASGYFKDTTEVAQAVVKILAGKELGFPPIAAMTGILIIKGRVTLSANLMAAAIKRSASYDYLVRDLTSERCEIAFFENGEEIGLSTFSAQDARQAGLVEGNWKTYPRNMLFARAISNGAKWYCPDIFGGAVYVPEELAGDAPDADLGQDEIIAPEAAAALEDEIRARQMTVRDCVELLQAGGAVVSPDADKTHLRVAIRALTPTQLRAISGLLLDAPEMESE